jgi:hypothetical protein
MSKFWAKNTGEDSSSGSEDDELSMESEGDTTTPMSVSETLNADGSLDQSSHSEAKLNPPRQSSMKVRPYLE